MGYVMEKGMGENR